MPRGGSPDNNEEPNKPEPATPALVKETAKVINKQPESYVRTVTLNDPTTGKPFQIQEKQYFFSKAPEPTLSFRLEQFKAPIIKEIGALLRHFGF